MTRRPFYLLMVGGLLLFLLFIFFIPRPAPVPKDQAGGENPTTPSFDPAAQFSQSCASCHGADLAGNPAVGAPKLTGLTLTPEEIANIAANGKGSMPPGMFTGPEEDRLALAKWILEHK
ncbi:MAG: cytochrome c [Thermicanus sp.]|nr:cytochrome c [Thermicanus sp.]